MDIKIAAANTQEFINKYSYEHQTNWPNDVDSLSYFYINEMLTKVAEGKTINEQAHRWLGWAQCAAVSAGVGTLEDMKDINYAA